MSEKSKASLTAAEAFAANEVIYRQEGFIATLTFNRPAVRNAMTFGMYEALYETCEKVDTDDSIRVLLLKGAGETAFVAGTDISLFRTFDSPEDAIHYEERLDRVVGRLDAVKKPVIAQLRGFAIGGGLAIAVGADLRLAAPDVQMGFPIARTLGNCLSMRNYARVLDLIGPARAKDLIFRARLAGAEEALAAGLITEIIPAGELEARTLEIAENIAAQAPLTLQVTKEAFRRLAEHRQVERADDLVVKCYLSDDFKEGVSAFLGKRKPVWQGR